MTILKVTLDWPNLSQGKTLILVSPGAYRMVDPRSGGLAYAEAVELMTRRMPAPWELEEIPGGYCIVDAEGKGLAYVYGLDEKELAAAGHQRLTKDEARRIAANIARLPRLLNSDG